MGNDVSCSKPKNPFKSKAFTTQETAPKTSDPELDFRMSNCRALRPALKSLVKNSHEATAAFLAPPARLTDVAENYKAINACMNHGGAGGISQSKRRAAQASDAGTTEEARRETKINRVLARESYDSAESMADAMRHVKEDDYVNYRNKIEAEVVSRAQQLIAQTDAVIEKGKSAQLAYNKLSAARNKLDENERRVAAHVANPSGDEDYQKSKQAVKDNEQAAIDLMAVFHDMYEVLMAQVQDFSVESMEVYLDNTVVFTKKFLGVIDTAGTSPHESTASEEPIHEESKEPAAEEKSDKDDDATDPPSEYPTSAKKVTVGSEKASPKTPQQVYSAREK